MACAAAPIDHVSILEDAHMVNLHTVKTIDEILGSGSAGCVDREASNSQFRDLAVVALIPLRVNRQNLRVLAVVVVYERFNVIGEPSRTWTDAQYVSKSVNVAQTTIP
jgi:hypothetical protein